MAKKSRAKKPASRPKKPRTGAAAKRTTTSAAAAKSKRRVRKDSPGSVRATAASRRAGNARRKKAVRAVALYERALATLQRRRLPTAAALFRRVIDEFPDERELHERCHRYLEVCARETTPAPTPETLEERVYAATLALNAGAEDKALEHLEAAVAEEPDSDHVQYMLAVARAEAGETTAAVTHLHRAIELNPDNRFLARHEPSFEMLRENAAFRQTLKSPPNND